MTLEQVGGGWLIVRIHRKGSHYVQCNYKHKVHTVERDIIEYKVLLDLPSWNMNAPSKYSWFESCGFGGRLNSIII